MKVKELIKLLSELDQEKEIKTINADYEQGSETFDIDEIRPFEPDGKDNLVDDYGDNKDFYVIE